MVTKRSRRSDGDQAGCWAVALLSIVGASLVFNLIMLARYFWEGW